jgi:hypothetical protein
MSEPDAVPLPREGEVFFDVRGEARCMRLSWYADSRVAVFSIWQANRCTGTFRLPFADLARMVHTLQTAPRPAHELAGPGDRAAYGAAPGYPLTDYDPPNYRDVPRYADAGYQEMASRPGQQAPGYPGGPAYPIEPGYQGDHGHQSGHGQSARHRHPGEPGHSGEHGRPADPAYSGDAAYPGDSGYRGGHHRDSGAYGGAARDDGGYEGPPAGPPPYLTQAYAAAPVDNGAHGAAVPASAPHGGGRVFEQARHSDPLQPAQHDDWHSLGHHTGLLPGDLDDVEGPATANFPSVPARTGQATTDWGAATASYPAS